MKKVYEIYADGYLSDELNWNGNGTFQTLDFHVAVERFLELSSKAVYEPIKGDSAIELAYYEVPNDWSFETENEKGLLGDEYDVVDVIMRCEIRERR